MKKIYSLFILSFFLFTQQVQPVSFNSLYTAAQEKLVSTSKSLVDNAWKIAGSTSLAISAASSLIIAKEALQWYRSNDIQDTIKISALCSLIPITTGILGLICFNIDSHFKQQNSKNSTNKNTTNRSRRAFLATTQEPNRTVIVRERRSDTVLVRPLASNEKKD